MRCRVDNLDAKAAAAPATVTPYFQGRSQTKPLALARREGTSGPHGEARRPACNTRRSPHAPFRLGQEPCGVARHCGDVSMSRLSMKGIAPAIVSVLSSNALPQSSGPGRLDPVVVTA